MNPTPFRRFLSPSSSTYSGVFSSRSSSAPAASLLQFTRTVVTPEHPDSKYGGGWTGDVGAQAGPSHPGAAGHRPLSGGVSGAEYDRDFSSRGYDPATPSGLMNRNFNAGTWMIFGALGLLGFGIISSIKDDTFALAHAKEKEKAQQVPGPTTPDPTRPNPAV